MQKNPDQNAMSDFVIYMRCTLELMLSWHHFFVVVKSSDKFYVNTRDHYLLLLSINL